MKIKLNKIKYSSSKIALKITKKTVQKIKSNNKSHKDKIHMKINLTNIQ